jgi:uncharacterized protein YpmS
VPFSGLVVFLLCVLMCICLVLANVTLDNPQTNHKQIIVIKWFVFNSENICLALIPILATSEITSLVSKISDNNPNSDSAHQKSSNTQTSNPSAHTNDRINQNLSKYYSRKTQLRPSFRWRIRFNHVFFLENAFQLFFHSLQIIA